MELYNNGQRNVAMSYLRQTNSSSAVAFVIIRTTVSAGTLSQSPSAAAVAVAGTSDVYPLIMKYGQLTAHLSSWSSLKAPHE